MILVVLASGRGSRLGKITDNKPKCLIKIHKNRTLLDHLSEKFYLFGHSAGGGFVHRYLLFKKEAPVFKAVAANPAFVTLPDKNTLYPFGLEGIPNSDKNIKSWMNKDMAILLGEDDLGPRTKPLSNGQMARAQGPNCLERGKLLYSETKIKAKELGFDFNWELITVPEVGHDNYQLAPFASIYLFGDKEEK